MAVPKDKLLTAIENKFKGKSLTKNFKEAISAKWAEKIDKEEDIEAYLNDREDVILEASAEADRRATEAAVKAKAEATKPVEQKVDQPEKVETPADAPDYIKALNKQLEAMATQIQSMQAEKSKASISERIMKDERLKDVPDFMKQRAIPAKEEDFENTVEALANDWKQFSEQNKLAPIVDTKPQSGTPKPVAEVKQASDDEVKDLLKDLIH